MWNTVQNSAPHDRVNTRERMDPDILTARRKKKSSAERKKCISLSHRLTLISRQLLFIISGATYWKPESGTPISRIRLKSVSTPR